MTALGLGQNLVETGGFSCGYQPEKWSVKDEDILYTDLQMESTNEVEKKVVTPKQRKAGLTFVKFISCSRQRWKLNWNL